MDNVGILSVEHSIELVSICFQLQSGFDGNDRTLRTEDRTKRERPAVLPTDCRTSESITNYTKFDKL